MPTVPPFTHTGNMSPASCLELTAQVLQALDELLHQASASRPTTRKTVTLSPAAIRGLRALLTASRDAVETMAHVIDHDPCRRTFYDILVYCKRSPRLVEDLSRALWAAEDTGFEDWLSVRRMIKETHAAQQEARRMLAQQIQPSDTPVALEGDTDV